ncbi:carbonic anhydrase [Salinifilum aidingensis]
MSTTDELLHRNASAPAGDPTLPAPPSLRVAILTCMDCRIDGYATFGLRPGEAHVLRNAGGVVTDDVVRSLAVSQRKLGTREVMVVHHTGCGMLGFTDEDFAAELAADAGVRPQWSARTYTDTAEDVRRCVHELRTSPFLLPEIAVRGFVLDIESLRLTEISTAGAEG